MLNNPFVASETLSAERAAELNKAEKHLDVLQNIVKELEEIGEDPAELKALVDQTQAVIAITHRAQDRLAEV